MIETNTGLASTKGLLTNVLKGEIIIPEVETQTKRQEEIIAPPPEDKELQRLKQRLHKASKILHKKRERDY